MEKVFSLTLSETDINRVRNLLMRDIIDAGFTTLQRINQQVQQQDPGQGQPDAPMAPERSEPPEPEDDPAPADSVPLV